MISNTVRIGRAAIGALVSLAIAVPVFPMNTAEAKEPRPIDGTSTEVASENEAAVQDGQAIDSGPWDQDYPSAAGDPTGNIYAVWEDSREGVTHVRFAERPAGGDWQPSVKIDPIASGDQWSPQIAVDGGGNLSVLWADARGEETQIYGTYRPASGNWQASQPVSATTEAQSAPALAVNRRGEAVAAWRQGAWPDRHLFCSLRSPSGAWGAGERVTDEGDPRSIPDVAIDDWGATYVAWNTWDPGDLLFTIRSPQGGWSDKEQIRDTRISGPQHASGVQIAVDGSRNVHAVWEDKQSGGNEIYAAYRPVNGSWSLNVRLDDGDGNMWAPGLGLDGAGNAVAAWSDENTDVYGAVRYFGSGWTPSDLLVNVSTSASAALADQGILSPAHPQAVESWLPALTAVGPTGALLVPAVTLAGDTNLFAYDVGAPGSNGCGGLGSATAAVAQTLSPQATIQSSVGVCHVGNGSQEPTLNGDDGFIGPPGPEEAGPFDHLFGDPLFADPGSPLNPPLGTLESPLGMGEGAWPGGTPSTDPGLQQMTDPAAYAGHLQQQADYYYSIGDTFSGDLLSAQGQAVASSMVWDPVSQQFRSPISAAVGQTSEFELFSGLGAILPEQQQAMFDDPYAHAQTFEPVDLGLAVVPEQQDAPLDLGPFISGLRGLRNILTVAGQGNVLVKGGIAIAEVAMQTYTWMTQGSGAAAGQGGIISDLVLSALTESERKFRAEGYRDFNVQGEPFQYVPQGSSCIADPILPHSGEFVHEETYLQIPARGQDYALQLTYHSQLVYDGPVGWGWEHSYDRRIAPVGGGSLALKEGDGGFDVYAFDGTTFTPPAGRYTTIVSTTAGITITDRHGKVEGYFPLDGAAPEGLLRSIADPNGNTLLFAYDGQGHLQTVTDAMGRDVTYTYDGNGRITSVTDFAGRAVTLEYDANGDLVSITTPPVIGTSNLNDFPLGKKTIFSYTFGYDDLRLNHNLTTIVSPNEVEDGSMTPRTINTYGEDGLALDRVVHQSWGGGRANASGIPAGGDVTYIYTTSLELDAPAGASSKTTITDRGGNVTELWHDGAGHRLREHQVVNDEALVTDYTYNTDGQRTSITYPAGNRVEYTHDDGAADPLAKGNLLEMRRIADASRGCDGAGGTPCPDLVTAYGYEPTFQFPEALTDTLGNVTTHTYDNHGNRTRTDFPGVTVGPAAPQSASQSWTYNDHGQPLTFTDSEGNVTCHEYYDSGPAEGYRQAVTRDCDGADLTTEYGYDAVGNVTVITDARGVRTDYEVNALNQVVKETRAAAVPDGASNALRFVQYDDVRRKDVMHNESSLTALGYETVYWYDANDNVVRVEVENVQPDLDADAHPTETHSRDAENPWLTTSYDYDLLDNVVTTTMEISSTAQAVTSRRYDAMENVVARTDPSGHRTTYAYDERSLVLTTTHGVATSVAVTTTSTYDANGNLVRTVDGEGRPTDTVFDGFDRRVGHVDALGNVTIWTLDANDNALRTVFRDGQDGRNPGRAITATAPVTLTHTVNQFDERNRRYAQRRALFTADVDTGIITPITTDGDGDGWVDTTTTYDRNGNPVATRDDNGNVTRTAFDGLDRVLVVTDALSNTVTYAYDPNGNLTQTVSTEHQPDGLTPPEVFTVTSSYDAVNKIAERQDTLGQTTRYAYDGRGNRVFTSDANGPVSARDSTRSGDFSRSTAEAVTTQTSNDHGNTALFTYDGLNRLVEETYHLREGGTGDGAIIDQVTMDYVYDASGNLIRRTDPGGNPTYRAYDPLNRNTVITYADGTQETFEYDGADNTVARTDPNGSVMTYTYDALNRHVRTDVARGPGVGGTTLQTFEWDGLSRQVAATDNNEPADPSDDSHVTFAYDSLSRRIQETQDGLPVAASYDGVGNPLTLAYPSGRIVTTTYDALNRVASVADITGTIASYKYAGPRRPLTRTNGNGTYTTYAYDGTGRITEVAHRRSSDDEILTAFSYTHDRVANRISETAQPGGTTAYTYDSLYRLVAAEGPTGEVTYTYDAAGNRVSVTESDAATGYTANEMHEYVAIDGESRTHDANGNLLSRRFSVESSPCQALRTIVISGPATTTVGLSTTFAAAVGPLTSTLPVTYTWAATHQEPVIHSAGLTDTVAFTWTTDGPHSITVTAVNPCGKTVTDTRVVTIEAAPPACPRPLLDVTIEGATEGYTDTLYPFTGVISPTDATPPVTYTWAPEPDTGQGTANASYQWAEPGVYTISISAENCADTVSDTHTVTIEAAPLNCPNPLASVSIEGATEGFTDTTYAFTGTIAPADATPPVTYTWAPEPDSGQGTPNASYQWAEPGVYTISISAENCGGTVSDTHTVTIEATPPTCPNPLAFVSIKGATEGVTDTTYAFTGTIAPTDATPPVTYTWSPAPASGQRTASATYQWATPGTHTITLAAENCGGTVMDSHSVVITMSDQPSIYLPLVIKRAAESEKTDYAGGLGTPGGLPLALPSDHTAAASTVVTDTSIRYRYDFANRLIDVTTRITVTEKGITGGFTKTVGYHYDALGRHVGSTNLHLLYHGKRVIEERDWSDRVLATYAAGLTMDRGGDRFFYQADAVGSTRAIADETGDVVERVDYDPFGAPVFSGGSGASAVGNPYLHRGSHYDADVELYVYGGRRLDPAIGRYTQRGAEVIGNPYTFARNNPMGSAP